MGRLSLFLLCLWIITAEGVKQNLKLFENNDCSGNSFEVRSSSEPIIGTGFEGAKSVKLEGVWQLTLQLAGLIGTVNVWNTPSNNPDGLCVKKADFSDDIDYSNFLFTGVRRVGPEDTETAALVLFDSSNWTGKWYTVTERTNLVTLETIYASIIFGNGPTFRVYPLKNYVGESSCISPEPGNFPPGEFFVQEHPKGLEIYSVDLVESCEVVTTTRAPTNPCRPQTRPTTMMPTTLETTTDGGSTTGETWRGDFQERALPDCSKAGRLEVFGVVVYLTLLYKLVIF